MANIPAISSDGSTLVYLKSLGVGTDADPFVPGQVLTDEDGNSFTAISVGTTNALSVAIVDGNGNQITSFGGGSGGGLTDAELRANAVPVTDGGSPLSVQTELTQPLTDAELRSSAIQVTDGGTPIQTESQQLPLYIGQLDSLSSLSVVPASDAIFTVNSGGLGIPLHDTVEITYDTNNVPTMIMYWKDFSPVATVSLTYDANGNLTTINRS